MLPRAAPIMCLNYHEESESECQSDEDDDGRDKQLLNGIKMRAADPRYLTTDDDVNRGDITLTKTDVGTEADQQSSDVWRELVSLHRRWSKITYKTEGDNLRAQAYKDCLLYTSPSPRDLSTSRMPSSA